MTVNDFLVQQELMEGAIKLHTEHAIEKFRINTGFCPESISIEMLDISKYGDLENFKKWRMKRRFKVGEVKSIIGI